MWLNELQRDIKFNADFYLLDKAVGLELDNVQSRYKKLPENWITFTRHQLSLDSISNIIKSYDLLPNESDVGFVFIVEALDKVQEAAIINCVFFNIKSRAILWNAKAYGWAKSGNMNNHWARAINRAISGYFKYYSKQYKLYKKRIKL